MNESAWEKTRRKTRNKILVFVLIVCPLGVVATILLLNNRDLIGFSGEASGRNSLKKLQRAANDTTGVTEETAPAVESKAMAGVSLPVLAPVAPQRDTVSGTAGIQNIKKKSETSSGTTDIPAASPDPVSCCTELLQPIACSLENRKDVVINLSLELFFTDVELRPAIRLRREDIKVMVWRTMQNQELSAIKINELETLLLQSIGTIFEHSGINKVKIKNIQIEKAEHK